MAYEVELVEVNSTPLAAVSARAELPDFARQIRRLFDQVYGFIRTHESVRQVGHNVIIYDGPLTAGSRVQIGVQVNGAFPPAGGEILSTTTPAGRAARTVHVGPYTGLEQAHDAVVTWCQERGLELAGRGWEVYGDWNDDPAGLRTEVLHLLA
jgi:effector-binding domain-containing protein